MEKARSSLGLVDLSKHNFHRTLDSLQESAHSLLLLSVQWKEIEGHFDSTKGLLEERAKELQAREESLNGRVMELESKEKELSSVHDSFEAKVDEFEKMEVRFHSECKEALERRKAEFEGFTKRIESMEKELEQQRDLRHEFEPLVSLLGKDTGCSSVAMSTNDLVKRNQALARLIPCLDPAKIVLDAIQASLKDFNDSVVVKSCIVLLEKLIEMNLPITWEVDQEATQLGINWISIAKSNTNNESLVLCCLLFLAAYGLASVTTREVLLNLLERFLLYDQAPRLFRLLELEHSVYGVVETLKNKEEYLAVLRFICEFRLYKLCPRGRPGALLHEYLISSDRAARVPFGTVNLMEAQKARREKIKADATMALECIQERKAEHMFPPKILNKLSLLKNGESAAKRAMEPVHKSLEGRQNTTNAVEKLKAESVTPYEQKQHEAKRQRLTEPITPSGDKIGESGDASPTHPLSTEAKPNNLCGSISADMLRELLEKKPLERELSNAFRCTSNPEKLVIDTSMSLCPTNLEGSYQFKLLITSDSCNLLLDQLKKLPVQIGHPVKGDAKKLAVYWREKITKNKSDELEVVCFLKFLGIYGIVSEFKTSDLLTLLDTSYWHTACPDLCQFLGLDNAITGFIQDLITTGHRLKAVNYIYSFGMLHKFHPVSAIINDSLRITKEAAEKAFRDAENEPASQVAAIDRQIRSLRAGVKCITCHKLESEFQLEDLEERIKSLLKLRRNVSDTAEPPSLGEVGSVSSNNTRLEHSTTAVSSSASKPGSRGQKRSQSSVHVASYTSDHFPEHGSSLNQRLTWPVDHYSRGFNSDYNHNQWTQPEGPPQYQQYYQQYDPYHRNHF
ncbi:PREDICTED: FRIGIDA-like protein 5 [Brassica oleracea var. oleracea]|uniref:FRIGIDA-like protein n=1 Tax=Brassica oleracea var. oleracea TaxID=109376 RepID=A0A0D3E123_BRAOL|nr:PREDICTED: FRIGIDA-like protein 5 [Brassica oleracea var. oleracea]